MVLDDPLAALVNLGIVPPSHVGPLKLALTAFSILTIYVYIYISIYIFLHL